MKTVAQTYSFKRIVKILFKMLIFWSLRPIQYKIMADRFYSYTDYFILFKIIGSGLLSHFQFDHSCTGLGRCIVSRFLSYFTAVIFHSNRKISLLKRFVKLAKSSLKSMLTKFAQTYCSLKRFVAIVYSKICLKRSLKKKHTKYWFSIPIIA